MQHGTTRDELRKREGEHIRNIACVNEVVAGRRKKEWRMENLERYNKYYIQNKEHILEYQKTYREENKEKIHEYNVKRSKDEKRKQYKLEKVECQCGCIISRGDIAKHKKSANHLEKFNSVVNS